MFSATRRLTNRLLSPSRHWGRWTLLLLLLSASATALDKPRQSHKPLTHTVYAGQRLGSIARRYHVSVEALRLANGLQGEKLIFPGQKLVIPQPGAAVPPASGAAVPAPGDAALRTTPTNTPSPQPASAPTPSVVAAPAPLATPPKGAGRVHVVAKGQRLGSIAKRYRLSIEDLCRSNDIDRRAPLRVGQRLFIPADPRAMRTQTSSAVAPTQATPATHLALLAPALAKPPRRVLAAPASWLPYSKKPWRRGYIELQSYKEHWKGYAVGPKGEVLAQARQHVSRVLSASSHGIDSRLIALIAKTSDQFGGRPLRIVSGYRERSYARASRHRMGRALDFSIPGVPNSVVRDFVRTFSNVGVGYYPNSTFVHLDVREYPTYWVDYSRPGQAPIYRLAAGQAPRTSAAAPATSLPSSSAPASAALTPPAVEHDDAADASEVELDAEAVPEKPPAPKAVSTPPSDARDAPSASESPARKSSQRP